MLADVRTGILLKQDLTWYRRDLDEPYIPVFGNLSEAEAFAWSVVSDHNEVEVNIYDPTGAFVRRIAIGNGNVPG